MKTLRLLLPLVFLLLPHLSQATYFKVSDYHIKMIVGSDGSLDITETISVDFTESRHGIIRSIPYSYRTEKVDGEVAEGRIEFMDYELYFDEIQVEDYNFKVIREYGQLKLKIGSGDVWVTGEQKYTIHYKVYGAINFFKDRAEIYWNLNGNEWTESIAKIRWDIELPGNVSKYYVWTGALGSIDSDAELKIGRHRVSGHTTRTLEAGEGATLGLTLSRKDIKNGPVPMRLLASQYYTKDLMVNLNMREDGVLEVWEELQIQFIGEQSSFERKWPIGPRGAIDLLERDYYEYEVLKSSYPGTMVRSTDIRTFSHSGNWHEEDGPVRFRYHYLVYNCLKDAGNSWKLNWNIIGRYLEEPCAHASIEFNYPDGSLKEGSPPILDVSFMNQDKMKGTYTSSQLKGETMEPLFGMAEFFSIVEFDKKKISRPVLPAKLIANDSYLKNHEIDLKLDENGVARFEHNVELELTTLSGHFDAKIIKEKFVYEWSFPYLENGWEHSLPNYTLFGHEKKLLVDEVKFSPSPNVFLTGTDILPVWYFDGEINSAHNIQYSYRTRGLLNTKKNSQTLVFPICFGSSEPTQNLTFRIHLPPGAKPNNASLLRSNYQGLIESFSFNTKGDMLIVEMPAGMRKHETLELHLSFPKNTFSTPLSTIIPLVYDNNTYLLVCIFLALLCFVTWYFIGKDKKVVTMVRFHPPEGVHPAEAGYLADFHVHDRDIISLLYFWAARGNLEIEQKEVGNKKKKTLTFIKKSYPDDIKPYQKKVWNKLFSGKRKKVKLSQLKNSFYRTLAASKILLKKVADRGEWFEKRSMTTGKIFRVSSVVSGITSTIILLLVWMNAGTQFFDRWDLVIGSFLVTIALWISGTKMPRRTEKGHKKWEELAGFKEFIDKAEKDKLEKLIDEDPKYFGVTLSYAIAFGMANSWVKKFKDLTVIPPVVQSSGTFVATTFVRDLNRDLADINKNFNSKPAPARSSSSGRSYSSSGSSSSSSSYSSSSYGSSGGSYSSSSSSGYSGGGYGGGGGSSW